MPTSYLQLASDLLGEHPHDVLFLTLNYDDLLEWALTRLYPEEYRFTGMADYVADARRAKVVKLHGSIDWFRLLPADGNAAWATAAREFDIYAPLPDHEIIVSDQPHDVYMVTVQDHRVYPVLTVPLAGKGPANTVCPSSHIAAAKEFIGGCSKFLIIGTSGLDADLLALLDSAVVPSSRPLVHVVDKGPGSLTVLGRFEEGVRAFRGASQPAPLSVFAKGFRNYLSSQQLQTFLQAD